MAQAAPRPQHRPKFTLNTDGHPHPRENALVGVTVLLGAIAFVTSFFHNLHILTSWTGLFGVLAGLTALFLSVTTAERFAVVIGTGAAAFGLMLGVAHGGLFGGVW
ncbi:MULTISPECIES: hypothetical protein [Kitasatospora]|uniref:Uncharacterized protein n=1 Tax=Kitasatospora setae (strain ATCC 33774 / DSM 43861 / JCM 3304 / KCC A-0304 / NBRC 14216 / KM-6054) TaxID=452652 RepID=E4MZB4_KITSK|nr:MULTISPECIES: hypothetical protein [Kitasatospora]BAJ29688.1 hypothetical protein KSE_38920 [Kitasatospora setae KM-6054]